MYYIRGAKKKPVIPNWGIAAILTSFVFGTYFYSVKAVGTDNVDQEILKQIEMQNEKTTT